MSLLIPNERDQRDAHADLDQDALYHASVDAIKQQRPHELPWTFNVVEDLFHQTDDKTDDMSFNYVFQDFGLAVASWETLIEHVRALNAACGPNECYKVLFLARHGQGFHNVASQKFSKEDWMAKWRFLGTDGDLTWGPDPELTPLGEQQAMQNNEFWQNQLAKGAPLPTKFFVSPLRRSANTLQLTWDSISIPQPVVCESIRETIGLHLCHQRSTKSTIAKLFPNFTFEPGFAEKDELAQHYSNEKESLHEQFLRLNKFLQSLFESDWDPSAASVNRSLAHDSTFISVTSHAGTIRSIITATGHRKFTIPTGGQIPIVVKGSRDFLD